MFSPEEQQLFMGKTSLDEIDRRILAITILHPRWSNDEIGQEIGLNRINVWRRKNKGPLASVLMEFQREAISSAAELVINESHDAVKRLGQLSRGECDCSEMIREQSDNHNELCKNPVPYAVQRQAAKDLIEILRSREQNSNEDEEEVWESVISEVGNIRVQKQIQGTTDAKT